MSPESGFDGSKNSNDTASLLALPHDLQTAWDEALERQERIKQLCIRPPFWQPLRLVVTTLAQDPETLQNGAWPDSDTIHRRKKWFVLIWAAVYIGALFLHKLLGFYPSFNNHAFAWFMVCYYLAHAPWWYRTRALRRKLLKEISVTEQDGLLLERVLEEEIAGVERTVRKELGVSSLAETLNTCVQSSQKRSPNSVFRDHNPAITAGAQLSELARLTEAVKARATLVRSTVQNHSSALRDLALLYQRVRKRSPNPISGQLLIWAARSIKPVIDALEDLRAARSHLELFTQTTRQGIRIYQPEVDQAAHELAINAVEKARREGA